MLNVIITQLSTAIKAEFIQVPLPPYRADKSLIHVFATLLVLHDPGDILTFCSNIHVSSSHGVQSGVEVLLRTWTETFEVIQGYDEIRLSVVALSRLFEFDVDGITVKDEEITEPATAGRILTRSQRRKGMSIS